MLKKMRYSLYKNYYRQYPASRYDAGSRTIMVDLPDAVPVKTPKTWERNGNHYTAPNGCRVYFWGSGPARNYEIETPSHERKTICPGVDSLARAIQYVDNYPA